MRTVMFSALQETGKSDTQHSTSNTKAFKAFTQILLKVVDFF